MPDRTRKPIEFGRKLFKTRGNGIIVGRKAPKIQNCPTCGRMRFLHPGGIYACPVPIEVTRAIVAYRDANGARWKSKLVRLWAEDRPLPPALHAAREMIGPSHLYKLKP